MVAVNLAAAAGRATYIDCDVEEPNGRLFLKPENVESRTVSTILPVFDPGKCTGCRKCVDFCRFHALMFLKGKPMLFSEVCHSCGGCMLVCPAEAITEEKKAIGMLEIGQAGDLRVVTGILNPGEASGVPVIREALKEGREQTIIDCPPGSACSVMESVMDADYCVLVVEPTAFGFHNFQMIYELVTLLEKPYGIVINKEEVPYEPLETFCKEHKIPVLARIPYDPEIAALAADGQIAFKNNEEARALFFALLEKIGGAV